LGGPDLLGSLSRIAAVCEEAGPVTRDGEGGAGPGEADKVTDVDEMGDEEAGKPGLCEAAA